LKNSFTELSNWLTHLSYIIKEIDNLLNLSQGELSNALGQQPVVSKLSLKREETTIVLNDFRKYRNNLSKAAECEDMDCDMFYVNEHKKYRTIYISHLENYRQVKEEYFNLILQ